MTRHTRRAALAVLGAAVAAPARAFFLEPVFLDGRGHAIAGYDPVAFWEFDAATRGDLEHALETPDGTWLFANARHREMFAADPARFTPRFGGYDAEGMARGFKRRSNPTLWVMIGGDVFLHYSIRDQNRWAQDIRGNIARAEENWAELRAL